MRNLGGDIFRAILSLSKKFFILVLLLFVAISAIFHLDSKTLPIIFARPFDVIIVDKKTGQPIPGAIVEVSWSNKSFSVLEGAGWSTKRWIMSDEHGRIRVPFYLRTGILSYLAFLSVTAYHPLYELGGMSYKTKAWIRVARFKENTNNPPFWAGESVKLELTTLWDKYSHMRCRAFLDKSNLMHFMCANDGDAFKLSEAIFYASQYYSQLDNPFSIKKYASRLIFDEDRAKNEWLKLRDAVYAESVDKPQWRALR